MESKNEQEASVKPEPKHICDHCNKAFNYKSILLKHQRIHTGEKPFICKYCGQTFSQVSNLIRHNRTHSNSKPYVCEKCDKGFTSSSNLKQHISIHQNQVIRSKFSCFIKNCKKSYLYICTLKKHFFQSHKKEFEWIAEGLKDKIHEKNFSLIYKELKKRKDAFDFVEFKEDEYFEETSKLNTSHLNESLSDKEEDEEVENINKKELDSTNLNTSKTDNKSCNCKNVRKVYSPIIIINNNNNIINNNSILNTISNNYEILDNIIENNIINRENKAYPKKNCCYKKNDKGNGCCKIKKEVKIQQDSNDNNVEEKNTQNAVETIKTVVIKKNDKNCDDFENNNENDSDNKEIIKIQIIDYDEIKEINNIESINPEIIENMKEDQNLVECVKKSIPEISVFKKNPNVFKKSFKCLKDFKIKKEDDFNIEDLHLLDHKRERNKEMNFGNFLTKDCWDKCGDYLVCPELMPQNCERYKNNECDCDIKCKMLEEKFKKVNDLDF